MATLVAIPLPPPEEEAEPQVTALAGAVRRSLVVAGVVAGAVGVMVAFLLSRWALAPLRALALAARRLGQGDLSQRVAVRGPQEVAELAHTFNLMAEGLERAERQRRALMADVAHELRTPLTNLQGYLEALEDGLLQPTPETLKALHQQVLQLARLVEDLRLLASAEAGSLQLDIAPTDLADLLRRSLEAVRPRAEAEGIALSLSTPQDLPQVPLDPLRIGQVVGNLLENALRHTPRGGRVSVSAERRGERVRVTVADTGPGIPPEHLPHIFERFYRVDPSRSRATGGAGLGLTIARSLVEAHAGRIWAESRPGEGSRFTFELPLRGPRATGTGR